ncbi:orc1/cdc6 family replication initiation protein [Candidatus Woesearchaeota archaeon]|nr:orc1/cdc6 family replication initiation protein [Candidatus Woesearchaeota archaeon]
MAEKELINFFENYRKKNNIFKNRSILQLNYIPIKIPHREEQINNLAQILAPLIKKEKPSNIFVYGKTGSGKTLCVKYVLSQLEEVANQHKIPIQIIYCNCKLKKIADTEYRLIAQLSRQLGKAIPATGLPTDEVYNIFYQTLNNKEEQIVIILDEVDQLIEKIGNDILYNLTRINTELKNTQLTIIGISNSTSFIDSLDPRVKSSLSEEEVIFPPYNALQLQTILKDRSEQSFLPNILEEGVISKCAAYAARDHGDARKAIELLRVAAELAERQQKNKINLEDLDKAEKKIENDRIFDLIKVQPKQYQTIFLSILILAEKKNREQTIYTGEIYNVYQNICEINKLRPLTQRRISDILAEFDTLGMINANIISKGRYGRTREIYYPHKHILHQLKKILEEQIQNE